MFNLKFIVAKLEKLQRTIAVFERKKRLVISIQKDVEMTSVYI